MAERTYKEWVDEYERLCTVQPKIFDLIARDPSPEALRLGVEHLLSLSLCELAMREVEQQWMRDRIARIEDRLGLSPMPLTSGGTASRIRRE
jgi:hypothetical protein